MANATIDILGLVAGQTVKGSDVYPAVDITDTTQSPIGSTKKYNIGALYSFILQQFGFVTSPPVLLATTTALHATYSNGPNNDGINATLTDASGTFQPLTIDGFPTVAPNTPYLIKDQASQIQNGVYFLTQQGDGLTIPWKLIRTYYFNSNLNIINNALIFCASGITNTNTSWQVSVPNPVIVGTSNIVFNPVTLNPFFPLLPLSMHNGGTGAALVPSNGALVYSGSAHMDLLGPVASGVLTSVGSFPTWETVLPLSQGGTNANLTASNGGIFYSTASGGAILAGTPTAGLTLISGSNSAPSWGPSSGGFTITTQIFDKAGTFVYTPTTGTVLVTIDALGAGGAGGGAHGVNALQASTGGGGGAGGYCKGLYPIASVIGLGASAQIIVGAGGVPISANVGGTGGNTIITANNGLGSVVISCVGGQGGSGGGGTNGAVNFTPGGSGGLITTPGNIVAAAGAFGSYGILGGSTTSSVGGTGASSPFGSGGMSSIAGGTSTAGTAAIGNGAGGSGGSSNGFAGNVDVAGGAGADGIIIITEYTSVMTSGTGHKPTIQQFLSGSGTYTLPANCTYITVEMAGGGGGGGGGGSAAPSGTAGTNTTFGVAFLTCTGGGGGYSTTRGAATGGDINIAGILGSASLVFGSQVCGGFGGSTPIGSGGNGGTYSASGELGSGYGAGGQGGGASILTALAGGNSAGYLRKLITSPSPTYAYAVGAQGTGGGAGASGFAGGNGQPGIITVTEYYN